MEERIEKEISATTGFITGQLMMFILIYYAPLHLALGGPHLPGGGEVALIRFFPPKKQPGIPGNDCNFYLIDLQIKHAMESSISWDGTLSSDEFHVSAIFLSERWKDMNPNLPPWTWIPFPRCASQKGEGYLSLESMHHLNPSEEHYSEGNCFEEEPLDNATLVQSYSQERRIYDFHILYSASYKVPVLYFRGYRCDGQPMVLEDIENDLPSCSSQQLKESKWTFMTREEHPYLNRPWFTLHPCGTSNWMKLLFNGGAPSSRDGVIQQYLLSWLSVVGQAVGLRIPIGMLSKSMQ